MTPRLFRAVYTAAAWIAVTSVVAVRYGYLLAKQRAAIAREWDEWTEQMIREDDRWSKLDDDAAYESWRDQQLEEDI